MLANQLSRTTIAVKFSINNGSGYTIISGNAIISALSINAPYKEIATYSITLQGIGAYTLT
jgi:predicted secreted protein